MEGVSCLQHNKVDYIVLRQAQMEYERIVYSNHPDFNPETMETAEAQDVTHNVSLQNERGSIHLGPAAALFLPSFLLSFSQISSLCFLLSVERACEAAYVNCPLPLVLHPL